MKAIAILACLCVPALGSNCHVGRVQSQVVVANQSAVVVPNGFVVVPFAVPVAVPSYVQYQAVPQPSAAAVDAPKPAAVAQAEASAKLPPSFLAENCFKCHSGATPKGKLDLTGPLSEKVKLHAIERILSDDPTKSMPKGRQLDAKAIGLLIQELSRSP